MKFKVYLFRNDKTKEIALVASFNINDSVSLMESLLGDVKGLVTGITDTGAIYESSNPKHKHGLILYNSFNIKL